MHVNIPQGHQVPLSGKYKCEWCGTLTVVGGMGRAEDVFIAQLAAENARANPTTRWFKEGAFLTSVLAAAMPRAGRCSRKASQRAGGNSGNDAPGVTTIKPSATIQP